MASEDDNRVFVGGLVRGTTPDQLAEAFRPCGTVIETEIAVDRETGWPRGFGFVTFTNPKSVRTAIHWMNNIELFGRTVSVKPTYPRTKYYDYNPLNNNNNNYDNEPRNFSNGFSPYGQRTNTHNQNYNYNLRNDNNSNSNNNNNDNNNKAQQGNLNQQKGKNIDSSAKHEGTGHLQCFLCGGTGNLAKDCTNNNPPAGKTADSESESEESESEDSSDGFEFGGFGLFYDSDDFDESWYDDYTKYCDICEDWGHSVVNCPPFKLSDRHFFCECEGEFMKLGGYCLCCGGLLQKKKKNPKNSKNKNGESSQKNDEKNGGAKGQNT